MEEKKKLSIEEIYWEKSLPLRLSSAQARDTLHSSPC